MLTRFLVLVFALALVAQLSIAQRKAGAERIALNLIANVGLVNGSKGSSVSLQSLLGGSYRSTFAGIGAGIDYYRFRSVPLFFDLRHDFGKGREKFVIYGDIGYNYDWLTDKNKENVYSSTSNYKGGIYYDLGIGFKILLKNKDAFILSTGYSVKKIKNEVDAAFCPFFGPCSTQKESYLYSMPRLVIRAGWSF